MTGIRRTALLAHPIRVAPDRVEAYRVELPPGQPAGPHTHPGPHAGYVERGRIAELASKYAGTEPRNVFITIHENDLPDWSFGEGIAQYATGPAPHDAPRHAPAGSSR